MSEPSPGWEAGSGSGSVQGEGGGSHEIPVARSERHAVPLLEKFGKLSVGERLLVSVLVVAVGAIFLGAIVMIGSVFVGMLRL